VLGREQLTGLMDVESYLGMAEKGARQLAERIYKELQS